MSVHAQAMTAAEFLAWEATQELRWEFDGVRPTAMTGGTAAHSTIQVNLLTSLNMRLRGSTCRAHGSDLMVAVGDGRFRYPDASVTCAPLGPKDRQMAKPVVLFEILSMTTATIDRTTKLIEYRSIPTLRRYVMLEQDQSLATVVTRSDTGWSLDMLRDDRTLHMPEIGIEVPITELYLGVDLMQDGA